VTDYIIPKFFILKNYVTQQCDIKREEFCTDKQNRELCNSRKPASTIWHGIMLKTDYLPDPDNLENNIFVTTISLSISKQRYFMNNTPSKCAEADFKNRKTKCDKLNTKKGEKIRNSRK